MDVRDRFPRSSRARTTGSGCQAGPTTIGGSTGGTGVPLYLKPGRWRWGSDAATGPAQTRDYVSDPAARPSATASAPDKSL